MSQHQTVYKLRNQPARVFHIDASVTSESVHGAIITAVVSEGANPPFTYVVEFGGEFTATKQNFTGEMYLHTAISVVQAQIESLKHRSTKLLVHRASGLIETSALHPA